MADEEDASFVGVTSSAGEAVPVYYDENESVFFGAEVDEENDQLRRLPDQEWTQDPTETVGEAIERLGDELGWDSLSEFAESHLEDEE